jgi:hypothetical protein
VVFAGLAVVAVEGDHPPRVAHGALDVFFGEDVVDEDGTAMEFASDDEIDDDGDGGGAGASTPVTAARTELWPVGAGGVGAEATGRFRVWS